MDHNYHEAPVPRAYGVRESCALSDRTVTDREAMELALELARVAVDHGDVPVGAVVLDESRRVIGCGYNRRHIDGDPLAHAEVIAIKQATQARSREASRAVELERWNLSGCTLVVSLEPCPMCAGAALQTHVERIVFGAWDAKLGACGSVWDILRDPHVGHRAQVIGGVMRERSEALLREFFETRRHDTGSADATETTSPPSS